MKEANIANRLLMPFSEAENHRSKGRISRHDRGLSQSSRVVKGELGDDGDTACAGCGTKYKILLENGRVSTAYASGYGAGARV